MFEVGDRVFYGVVGVCEVEDIAAPPIKGIDGKYYYFNMGAVMAVNTTTPDGYYVDENGAWDGREAKIR